MTVTRTARDASADDAAAAARHAWLLEDDGHVTGYAYGGGISCRDRFLSFVAAWARPRTRQAVDKGQWVDDSAVDQPSETVGDDEMIMICERCCTPIAEGDPVVRYAHIDRALPDGSILWMHSYVHTTGCQAPQAAPHERPDTGEWDATRGVGVHRADTGI